MTISARIDRLGETVEVGQELVAALPSEQQDAIRAHVIDERSYRDIARATRTSEAVLRKRVSRGRPHCVTALEDRREPGLRV